MIDEQYVRDRWEKALNLIAKYSESLHGRVSDKVIDYYTNKFLNKKNSKGLYLEYFDDDLKLKIDIDKNIENFEKADLLSTRKLWVEEKGYNIATRHEQGQSYKNIINFVFDHLENFTAQELIRGKVAKKTEVGLKNSDNIILDKNTKLTNYFKHLIKDKPDKIFADENYSCFVSPPENVDSVLQFFYDMYSQFLSTIKNINGTVVLSADPVDYVMCSVLTTGWTSCFDFRDGEYRTAPLSYALDRNSLVSYAYSYTKRFNKDIFDKEIPVKSWREWVIFEPEAQSAYFGRNYPTEIPIYSKYTRKLAGKLLAKFNDEEPVWNVTLLNDNLKDFPLSDNEYKENISYDVSYSVENGYGYEDYINTVINLDTIESDIISRLGIAENNFYCLECGNDRIWHDGEECSFVCAKCDDSLFICDDCGNVFMSMDSHYVDGKEICYSCMQDRKINCEHCQCSFDKGEIESFKVSIGEDYVDKYICNECLTRNYELIKENDLEDNVYQRINERRHVANPF